ncbi:hypothetical protein ACFL4W_01995 [Planctomycetota bacterium]
MQKRHLGLFLMLTLSLLMGCSDSSSDKDDPTGPSITSSAPSTANVGVLYTYTITAAGSPAPTISVSGLPGWLGFNGVDTISGTPGSAGTTGTITVTAANGVLPDAQEQFTITITDLPAAPVITSSPVIFATAGNAYEYIITVSGNPVPTITVTGEPGWLNFDNVDTLSGTPGSPGTTGTVTVTATNGSGTDTQDYQITVQSAGVPQIGGVAILPADSPWNQDISALPVHPNSANYLSLMSTGAALHFDMSIPFNVVDGSQADSTVTINGWPGESDKPPADNNPCLMPIPDSPLIEGGSDAHCLILDTSTAMLYELFASSDTGSMTMSCSGTAVWDLTANDTRWSGMNWNAPDVPGALMYWTSADAAGLPIFPGLIRYDEVDAGEIKHALRVTFSPTQKACVYPASHWASNDTNSNLPPMGLRLRLKASFDISGHTLEVQVILTALKKYGLIVADNGSDWYISGQPHASWDYDNLNEVHSGTTAVWGSDFEVVQTGYTVYTP